MDINPRARDFHFEESAIGRYKEIVLYYENKPDSKSDLRFYPRKILHHDRHIMFNFFKGASAYSLGQGIDIFLNTETARNATVLPLSPAVARTRATSTVDHKIVFKNRVLEDFIPAIK
mgnify:CR=1 FL=1